MRVDSITLENFKAHQKTGPLELGSVTVLVGLDNAGKSSILQALYGLQTNLDHDSIRRGAASTRISLALSGIQSAPGWATPPAHDDRGTIVISPGATNVLHTSAGNFNLNQSPSQEPNHFVIPFLSKRKVGEYAETTTIGEPKSIRADLHNLPAKLSRIANAAFPEYERFASACKEVLGDVITSVASAGGQKAGVYVDQDTTITV